MGRPYGTIGDMKEYIYSRNAVYETLRAKRREVFKLEIADNVQVKGKMADIMALASQRKISVAKVKRAQLDKIHENNQGIVAEVSAYPYSDEVDILDHAKEAERTAFHPFA